MALFKNHNMLTVNEGINRARTEKNAVLLDVRSKDDYKKGHIAGAINISNDKLEQIKTRVRDLAAPIYVVGDYKNNPKKAARQLKKMGYTNVYPSGNMEEHHGILKK